MREHIHRFLSGNGKIYEYPAIKSATRQKGKYISFMRVYGEKRTRKEAIELVAEWEKKNNIKSKGVLNGN